MLYWIYELPTVAVVGVFAALFVAICWVATILSRPIVQARIHRPSGLNELVGDFMQYFGVIYGLLLGLLAVATYQSYAEVENTVENEASSLAALYRDVSSYPEPKRSELEAILRDYTRYVIDEAWPLQRKGIVPAGAVKKVADFQASLVGFEPQTKSQEVTRRGPEAVQYVLRVQEGAPPQRDLEHPGCHVVHGRGRCAPKYFASFAV